MVEAAGFPRFCLVFVCNTLYHYEYKSQQYISQSCLAHCHRLSHCRHIAVTLPDPPGGPSSGRREDAGGSTGLSLAERAAPPAGEAGKAG